MNEYASDIENGYVGYFNYLVTEILQPSWHNYFYWLLGISLVVWLLELAFPWRKKQAAFRKDFWLDAFYMFFNFFLFSLIGFNALSLVAVRAFNDFLALFGISNLVAIQVAGLSQGMQLLVLFVVADFIQWNTHRLLHRVSFLWEFHKVHHSVEEMGFAAHLRFHWLETVVYKSIQFIPISMLGFSISDFILVHIITILIGHLNHANLNWSYGPLKYIFNNPNMHIWHHAKHLDTKYGVNFGISLSLWDYLFGTALIKHDGRDIELGFKESERYPTGFLQQCIEPFKQNSSKP